MGTITAPLLVIGGGNMGRAIIQGAVAAGEVDPARVVIADPDDSKHRAFTEIGVACRASAGEAITLLESLESTHGAGVVMLAVKPQMLELVDDEVGERLRSTERLVLSILAGKTAAGVREVTGGRVVRLMPNTPAQVGRGITAVSPGAGSTESDRELTHRVFNAIGRVIDLPEDLIDAFTAVAGSGPAYVFYLAEGMLAGAEAVGFDRAQGLDLVRATISGAATLLEQAAAPDPLELRAMVTSKGGTTAAATTVLDERAVSLAQRDAIVAARDRGRQLAGG